MSVYNVQELIASVERRVALEAAQEATATAPISASNHESLDQVVLPEQQLSDRLEAGEFRNLRGTWAVDRVPPGTRLGFLKKTALRLLRIVAGPQALFNYNSFSATQQVAWEVDRIRQLLTAQEARRTSEVTRLRDELHATTTGLAESRQEVDRLRTALANATAEIRTKQQRAEEHTAAALATSQKRVDEIRTSLADLSAAQQRTDLGVAAALEDTKGVAGQLRLDQLAADTALREHLKSEVAQLSESIATTASDLTEQLTSATRAPSEITAQVTALREELNALRNETGNVPFQLSQMDLRFADQLRVAESLRATIIRIEDGMPEFRARLESAATMLAGLTARTSDTETRLRGVIDRREEDAVLLGSIRQTLAEVQTSLSLLRHERSATLTPDELDLLRTGTTRLWSELTTLHKAMDARDAAQTRALTEVSASLLDTARQTTRETIAEVIQAAVSEASSTATANLSQVYESLNVREKALWGAHESNHRQLEINTLGIQELHGNVGGLGATIKELKARLVAIAEELRLHSEELERTGTSAPAAEAVVHDPHVLDASSETLRQRQRRDLAYLRFQKQFRADRETLLDRHRAYVPLLEGHLGSLTNRTMLDVACGDGILVEILAAAGANATGVDLNEVMVREARERNLTVVHEEALAFMAASDTEQYDVLSAMQFVEHLPSPILRQFLGQAFRLLKPGGLLLIETINPHCLRGLKWFHLDLTHEKLVFPEMLEILAESEGFESLGWKGINPVDAWELLDAGADPVTAANSAKVNRALFGDQDYHLVARKPLRKS